ncbi:MAG: flagellar hook assembly protein FlgD, partial [Hoeflea sp.]|nr:flagellar hook assembly protein FlgD [Hoeflea sp.]
MDVSAVSSASATAGSAADSASKKATLDYDTFLTLLVQQMKN